MTTLHDVMTARTLIRGYVHETPILTSNALRQITDHEEIVLKCENLQRTGCYNLRGVMNYVIRSKQIDLGINHFVAQSTGNHGLAVALAANSFAATGHIVVPEKTKDVVVDSILHYGGEVYRCGPGKEERMRLVQKLVDTNNNCSKKGGMNSCVYVHQQDECLIAGNGTAGAELMLQTESRLDAVLVPAVCGTLLAGVAVAVKGMKPNIAVYGAECDTLDPTYEFEQGAFFAPVGGSSDESTETACNKSDVKTSLGRNVAREFATPLTPAVASCINQHVDGVLKVTEAQVRHAFRFIYERCKLVIDANAATGVAALLSCPETLQRHRRIGIFLSGGNVELEEIPKLAHL